jgi:hypothetical protein
VIPPPQRTRPTEYRKPGKINSVSLTMLLFLGVFVYVVYALWPAVTLRLRVKSELEDVLPTFWRVNLRPEEFARQEIARMKRELLEKLPKVGVRDKHLEVVFERGKQRVAIEARFSTSVTFPVLNKTRTFQLAPRAETDAARVDW